MKLTRIMSKGWLVVTLLMALISVSLGTFLSGTQAEEPVYGGTLIVAESAEPPGLDPTTNAAAAIDRIVNHNLFEGLVMVDPKGNIVPGLAERWEISANGLEYTFYLRSGVKFHDGRPLTAADVKYTIERDQDPETGHPHPEYYADIAEIEIVDDLTIKFKLSKISPALLSNLALGDSIIVPQGAGDELKSHPIGTGPFQFVEWVRGDHVTLARFEDYYGKDDQGRPLPYLDKVIFRFIPDPSAALAALRAGDVDAILLSGEQVPIVEADPNLKIVSGPQNLVQIMAINNSRKPFDDVRVRRAISYAIDKEAVIEGSVAGYGTPIGSHMTPVNRFYVDVNWMYPYDPEKAKELLAAAGYPDGFKATLRLPEPYLVHQWTGEIIADQLSRVGIELELEIIEWGRWLDEVYSKADYDLTIIGHIGKMDPAAMLSGYSPKRPNYYFRRGYENPWLDKLMEEGELTSNFEKRKEIYADVQHIIAADAVNYFIQDPHVIRGLWKNVENFQIFPIYVDDVTKVYKTE